MSSKPKSSTTSNESARPTVKPPIAAEELASKPEARRTPGNMRAVRDAQVTVTNEVELEAARLKSMESPSMPSPSAVIAKGEPIITDKTDDGGDGDGFTLAHYESRLGSLDRVPVVVMSLDGLRDLAIDHRAGFLLSHIDGVSSLETILDVSGMPRLDAVKILVELVQKRVVALR